MLSFSFFPHTHLSSSALPKPRSSSSASHANGCPPQPLRACVAPPPLVPPRPTPAIPPPLLGTTPCHLCLLDRRLLYRLLSGTAPRHLCLLDRRLLQARRAQGCRRRQNLSGERGLVEDEQGARGGSRQAPAASAKSERMPPPSKPVGGERSGSGQAGA